MKRREWSGAVCRICGAEYLYGAEYKPVTCGKLDCLLEANKRGLLKPGGGSSGGSPPRTNATASPGPDDMPADVEAYYNERAEEG